MGIRDCLTHALTLAVGAGTVSMPCQRQVERSSALTLYRSVDGQLHPPSRDAIQLPPIRCCHMTKTLYASRGMRHDDTRRDSTTTNYRGSHSRPPARGQ